MRSHQWKQHLGPIALSVVFRYLCYAVMVWLALWGESRPAPTLPDFVLEHVPYVPWVDRYNYLLWLVAYVPIALVFCVTHTSQFVRYMVSSGLVALLRGVCIVATGLGPVHGPDLHVGMDLNARWRAFLDLMTPFGFFAPDSGARVYLIKDLFFSGHTATTFLLLLYVWPERRLRWLMLVSHGAVVLSLFFAHLHYTIDVIGAYAVTFSVYVLREGWAGPRKASETEFARSV
jgi:hypothetical protein